MTATDGIDWSAIAADGLAGPLTAVPDPPDTPGPGAAVGVQYVTVTMDDGSIYAATLDARDRRAYALNAQKYGLPPITAETATDLLRLELLTTFSAWNATRYRLELHGDDWPTFNAHAVEITSAAAPGPVTHPPGRGAG